MKISEIRAKYPEYADLPDEQLVIGLHRKFYSDMPFREFHKNITYDVLPPEPKLDPSKLKIDYSKAVPLSSATYDGKPITQKQVAELMTRGEFPKWGEGIPKAADQLGGWVTDKTGSPAAGYAANVALQAVPALASSYRFAGSPLASMTEKPARTLMQSALKPSSTVPQQDIDRALGTMLEEGISPTRGGMDKASKLAERLNQSVNQAISASPETVNVNAVTSRAGPLAMSSMEQVNPNADMNAVKESIQEFLDSPHIKGQRLLASEYGGSPNEIPVALAQKLKSGTYTSIGNKAYGELGSGSVEAQKALAAGLRGEVISKVPEIAEPLKREASLRNVMEVAATRAAIDSNKNPLSLGTSIAAMMHDPLSAAGMWANASTPVKAMMARMLFTAGRPEVALPAAMTAQEALNQPQRQ